jgi:hypothetical protein
MWLNSQNLTISPASVSGNNVIFSNGIRLGSTADTTAGNMRYAGSQFQGYNGTDWVALSGGGGADTTCEDSSCNLSDDYGFPFINLSFAGTTGFSDLTDNYEADTNCSSDGSCGLITYDSETSAWDKNAADDFDGAWSSLTGVPAGFADDVDNDTMNCSAEGSCGLITYDSETSGWDKNEADDFDGAWSSLTGVPAGFSDNVDNDTTLSQEEVEDYTGGMTSGTETNIAVTYNDGTGNLDYVVSDNWINESGDTMSGNLAMEGNNVTGLDCLHFASGGKICDTT